jgi:hypothetical protein
MGEMSFNSATNCYEGFNEDGRLVTVTMARWESGAARLHEDERSSRRDPAFWEARMMEPEPGVVVWRANSFPAKERQAQPGQVLYTVRPPAAASSLHLRPQVFVRPSPLGYGVQMAFPDHAAVFAGHLRDAAALSSAFASQRVGLASGWAAADQHLRGVPLPPPRPFLEEFPAETCSRAAYTMVARLEGLLPGAGAGRRRRVGGRRTVGAPVGAGACAGRGGGPGGGRVVLRLLRPRPRGVAAARACGRPAPAPGSSPGPDGRGGAVVLVL